MVMLAIRRVSAIEERSWLTNALSRARNPSPALAKDERLAYTYTRGSIHSNHGDIFANSIPPIFFQHEFQRLFFSRGRGKVRSRFDE